MLCLHSKVSEITSARPNDPPIPAPMPARASLDDDDDDDDDGVTNVPEMEVPLEFDDVAARDVVKVAVVLTLTEAAFVVFRDVKPDVGLNITGPASIENGDLLSFGATRAAVGGGLHMTTAKKIVVV